MTPKTFTIKELASANGLSVDTIERRIKRKEINLSDYRISRFKCPIQYDTEKAAAELIRLGYDIPERR